MKTKGHRIFGCLLLICAVGLVASICTSVASSKTPLSDNALSSIYGGCGVCLPNGEGCDIERNTKCSSRPVDNCANGLTYRSSCRQEKKSCQGSDPSSCVGTSWTCGGIKYNWETCKVYTPDEGYPFCTINTSGKTPCHGTKAWCWC